MEKSNKKILQNKTSKLNIIELIFPMLHFLLTFVMERSCFVFSNNWEYSNEIARNNYISNSAEVVITYILSKICAAIFIWLLWKLIFGVIKGRIPKNISVTFGLFFLVGLVVGLFLYPDVLSVSIDTYTNYTMAIRFLPTYWQSIYTGVVFAGSMMVIPHSFSIFIFQWLSFVAVVAYIFHQVDLMTGGKNIKYATLLLFFLPETYYIATDPYRNNFYAILCLFYFAYLIFMEKKSDKAFQTREMLIVAVLSAFIMVWRTEGILIGLGGMCYLFLYVYKTKLKKVLLLVFIMLCSFVLLSNIQNIGAQKYYGEDYMIVNTTDVLYHIFNHPKADMYYDGVTEDLAAIEAVVPVRVLKEAGMAGYRNYNFSKGHEDFNQTLATDEAAANYMSAYYSIILHNISYYLDVQLNCFFNALEVDIQHHTYDFTGEYQTNLAPFDYFRWGIGKAELLQNPLTGAWNDNSLRKSANIGLNCFICVWQELWKTSGINAMLHVVVLLADILILFVECVKLLMEKKWDSFKYIILFVILMGEFAAVFLFMPVGRPAYLYPMLYTSYLLIFVYCMDHAKTSKKLEVNDER